MASVHEQRGCKLRVLSGAAAGEEIEVDRERVIGREGADLTIDDPEMSRRHAAVHPVPGGVAIEDLGSLNGTFVNGERISGEVKLSANGTVRVGATEIGVQLPAAATDLRPIEATPAGVTAPHRVQPLATPDVTVVRPTASAAGPAPSEAPPQAGPAAAPAGPPAPPGAPPGPGERPSPPPPRYGAPSAGRSGGSPPPSVIRSKRFKRIGLLLLGLLIIAGAVIGIVLATSSSKKSPVTHAVSGRLRGAVISASPTSFHIGGQINQVPGGTGAWTGTTTLLGNPASGKPTPIAAVLTERFDAGRLDISARGTVRFLNRTGANRIVVVTGKVTNGTGAFAHATGTIYLRSHETSLTAANFTFSGTIRY